MISGAATIPVIEEYSVGPLPGPVSHTLLNLAHWRNPIPYYMRSVNAFGDRVPLRELIEKEMLIVNQLIKRTTGYSFGSGCQQKCLTYSIGGVIVGWCFIYSIGGICNGTLSRFIVIESLCRMGVIENVYSYIIQYLLNYSF